MNVGNENQYRYYRPPIRHQQQPVPPSVEEKPKEFNLLEYVTQMANSIDQRLTKIETILK
mgnify:FL=1